MGSLSIDYFSLTPIFLGSGLSSTENTDMWTDSAFRFDNPNQFSLLMSLIILHVIPSLIGYTIIGLIFNCATWSFFTEHKFRQWANLTSYLPCHIISPWIANLISSLFHTHGSDNFRFTLPFAWCRWWLIIFSWNPSTNVSWSSSTFWALLGYQSKSWWEMPSSSLGNLSCHRQHPYLPFITNLFMLWMQLVIRLILCSTLECYHLLCQECC